MHVFTVRVEDALIEYINKLPGESFSEKVRCALRRYFEMHEDIPRQRAYALVIKETDESQWPILFSVFPNEFIRFINARADLWNSLYKDVSEKQQYPNKAKISDYKHKIEGLRVSFVTHYERDVIENEANKKKIVTKWFNELDDFGYFYGLEFSKYEDIEKLFL